MRWNLRAVVVLAASVTLVAGACTPPPADPSATFRNGRCVGTEGVTVVIDFAPLSDRVVVRCALGAQTNGFSVLDDARVPRDSGPLSGVICQLDGLPAQGYPFCWITGGFWSYWNASTAGSPWAYSQVGPGSGPAPAPGSVQGWRFAPFGTGAPQPPRVATSGPITP